MFSKFINLYLIFQKETLGMILICLVCEEKGASPQITDIV